VFHVKHTRHTHPAPPSASMLPHFAQLPPGAAPHSKRGPRTPSPSAPHPNPNIPPQVPQAPNRTAVAPAPTTPSTATPSTPTLTPSVLSPIT